MMDAWIWMALPALLALALYYPRWTLRRALARPLPPRALRVLQRNVRAYAGMPAELQQQLQRLVRQFLHQKKFIGCDGLEVSDEMAVTVAGNACLLLLNRPSKVYPALHTIVLYPGAFVARRNDIGAGGVVTPYRHTMLGESWDDGRVVLSWDDVLRNVREGTGHNVVLHEFAHQLDSESGRTNGAPYLGNRDSYRRWSEVLSRHFAQLRYEANFGRQGVLDHYGATNPAEFFAVATEAYFERPHQMAERHPELYAEFGRYYRADPRAWLPAPPPPEPIVAPVFSLSSGC